MASITSWTSLPDLNLKSDGLGPIVSGHYILSLALMYNFIAGKYFDGSYDRCIWYQHSNQFIEQIVVINYAEENIWNPEPRTLEGCLRWCWRIKCYLNCNFFICDTICYSECNISLTNFCNEFCENTLHGIQIFLWNIDIVRT